MYKFLLCWRYLLTRYLALVCIVSVLLGVATLIVVNSVMAGFSSKLRDRLHGALSDIVMTMLSGFLTFCDRPVYGYYLMQPNVFGISPLTDQRAGAAAMWVIGSMVFLVPAVVMTVRLIQQGGSRRV